MLEIKLPRQNTAFKLAALYLSVAVVGCSDFDQKLRENTLIYCSEGNPDTFNPQLVTSGTTIDATSKQLYDRLLNFEQSTKRLIPGLAESWKVSDDGLTYTFKLRPQVYFHNTDYFTPSRPMNADDVIFSFNRWKEYDHPYHQTSGGTYPYFQGLGLDLLIKSISKVDPSTVEIELNKARGSFLAHLATDFAVILSEEYATQLSAQNNQDNIDKYPIGTGPFKFKSYNKNKVIRYKRHEQYWRPTSVVDDIIFDITKSDQLRLAKLIAGECDLIAYPLTSELDLIENNPKLKLEEQTGLNVGYWAFNTQRAPFDNVLVRKALSHAIDIDTILKAVYYGTASKAKNIIPPSSWAYDQHLAGIEYSPERARELLSKAGYENGFAMTIWAMPIQRAYNPNAKKMAQLIQANLKDIGIEAQIVSYDWGVFRDKVSNGEHDSVLMGWTADNGDPDNFFSPMLSCASAASGGNRALWCNAEFDRLIGIALDETEQQQRKYYYTKAQQFIVTQVPLLPIAHANRYQAHGANIKGMAVTPLGGLELAKISKVKRQP